MMKCVNCKWPELKDMKKPKNVMAKVCINCGKPQAARASMKSQKPVKK